MTRHHSAMALVIALAAVAASALAMRPESRRVPGEPKTIVIMLDGVPFALMDSLYNAGHFRAFRQPSRVISPFPSLTGVALRAMWGTPPPAGYEDRYYDPAANEMRGGLWAHVSESGEYIGFRRHVDIEPAGLIAMAGYVIPSRFGEDDVAELRDEIIDHALRDSVIVAYVVATDALAHRQGRAAVVHALLALEPMLDDLRARLGPDTHLIMFSDHGNDFVRSRRVSLIDSLEAAGFNSTERIETATDVVVPRFGLVGSSFLYSAPKTNSRLATALVDVPGVDLVAYEDATGTVHVCDARGHALIDVANGGERYRYRPRTGDPLGLAPAVERLRRAGLLDAAGFAPDSAWLNATLDSQYVDALRRIVRGMRVVVMHPATVLVSYDPGWYFGNPAADVVVDVAGTHGSLRTSSSLAFFMSTRLVAPRVLRSDEVSAYLPGR